MRHHITAHLMGGLGNQMFQYAAARAIALRNDARLYVDNRTGFARDKVYRRTYELGAFPVEAAVAGAWKRGPFMLDTVERKLFGGTKQVISNRVWGSFIQEFEQTFLPEVARYPMVSNTWMRGYWQSEAYFRDVAESIRRELTPPTPTKREFVDYGELMRTCSSVAVGIRLFEEVPGASKTGVGGLTPLQFFTDASRVLAETVRNPVFFVFCTHAAAELSSLNLPGKVHLVTHDNGFQGSLERLWLLAQCQHHILSNSTFYWWGAWLSESQYPNSQIIASPLFANDDTIPARWKSLSVAGSDR
jgi:hypothetical protein